MFLLLTRLFYHNHIENNFCSTTFGYSLFILLPVQIHEQLIHVCICLRLYMFRIPTNMIMFVGIRKVLEQKLFVK